MVRQRRKWTEEEDALLREAVNKAKRESRPLLWRELAKSVPGRTNKDCRRRWWNSLSDNMKGPWTESEDERLFHAVQMHGSKWTRVASGVRTRNSDQCASHWTQSLNPDINHSDWTVDEDRRLLREGRRFGTNWVQIAAVHSPKRTTLSLKNRLTRLRTKSGANPLQQSPGRRSREQTSSSCSDAGSGRAARAPRDEQTDDDDDDDESSDMDDENEEEELVDSVNPHSYWNDDLMATSTEQWQNLTSMQKPSTCAGTGAEANSYVISPGVEQWMSDALASPLCPELFSFNFNGDAVQPAAVQQNDPQGSKSTSAALSHDLVDPSLAVADTTMAHGGFETIPGTSNASDASMIPQCSGEEAKGVQKESLHRVSVDLLCTNEQLGTVLRNLAGLAKSVTVKVES